MNFAAEMQSCMVTLDVQRAREIWGIVAPHLPPITTDEEMLATLHVARTQSDVVSLKLRFYSHHWLCERNMPSLLPDELKPSAEKVYPRKVQSVGISVNARSELTRPIIGEVRGAMEDAVSEVYADGRADDIDLIKRRMIEARHSVTRKLLGRMKDNADG
jgi:hypothetical protein